MLGRGCQKPNEGEQGSMRKIDLVDAQMPFSSDKNAQWGEHEPLPPTHILARQLITHLDTFILQARKAILHIQG